MFEMTGVIKEIEEILAEHHLTPKDIKWIGSYDGVYALTYEEFYDIFKCKEYDNGYGSAEIALDLVVVGDGWWLERNEYDGSEWWEYKTMPIKKAISLKYKDIFGCWDTLRKINDSERNE